MNTETMRRESRGFTLAELAVSVAITGVIGTAVAGMAMVMSTAHEHGRDRYLWLQTARIGMFNIQNEVRKAKLVTAAASSSMVLWAEDRNGDGRINISEVVFLGWNSSLRQIERHRVAFPEYWSEAMVASMNVEVELNNLADGSAALSLLMGSPYEQVTVLANDVTGFEVSTSPAAPLTDLVGLGMTVGAGERAVTLRSAVHLRAEVTGLVGMSDGQYVLLDEDND